MLTDLVQIRFQGEKKRDENMKFRQFMKSRDYSDRILRRIAEEIEDQIDCTECANCCKVATAVLQERDIERLSGALRLPRARVIAEYAMENDEGLVLRRTEEAGCVFLDGKACTIYEDRPDSCRRFPNVVRGNGSIASRMWEFVDRAT